MTPQPKRRNPATRYDLQGVRGVGVILVVIGHLYLAPQGVFTALDIFFVLSGFVITKVLLDMADEHGRIYFVPFYLARARRLLPMGLFVTAVTIAASYWVFNPERGDRIAEDGFWSSIFWANWHFANQGTDYFATQGKSPFLHYWSLSVEEQFYAVWPLLLFAVIFVSRRMRSNRPALFVAVSVVVVGFFCYSLWHSVAAPTVAYFSTFDRAWQFGIGGLLAIAQPVLARLPSRVALVLSYGGFLSLAFPIFLLHHEVAFPAPWGLLPVLCTAAVVAAGVGRDTRRFVLIDNRLMTYIGDISYSVYLWHLPLIVLLRPFFEVDWQYEVAVIALTAILSVVFFYLVERPMRTAMWLMTPPEKKRFKRRVRRSERKRRQRRLVQGWLVAGLVLVAAVGAVATTSRSIEASGELDSLASAPQPQTQTTGAADGLAGMIAVQRQRLILALNSTTYPTLNLSFEDLDTEVWRRQLDDVACSTLTENQSVNCVFGSSAPDAEVVVVVGDSVAAAWMPGLLSALGPEVKVVQLTGSQCGTWTLPGYFRSDGAPYPECADLNGERDRTIATLQPDLIVLASGEGHVENARRTDLSYTREGVAEAGMRDTLRRYAQWSDHVVVLQPRPKSPSLVDCMTRFGDPDDCEATPSAQWSSHAAGERAAAEAAGATYVSTEDWFCVSNRCPGWIGTTPATVDGIHLSIPLSEELAPLLAEALSGVR
ncbi:acyltransferase family protein [Nocardioides zeae]|uniref:Acyltransferase n=1 Tax=Nocardioides zeae TaxID=1457234 RepID=A0A6P0HMQ8_9ACTN|nr:acyltransferase family protein [Nocardioides zeae]NEN79982.1 acyltransferase [Nocardioides zeae]